MSTAFTGIRLNVNEDNWEKAREWAEKLKELYNETSKMVPEWKDYFKPKLADDLVKAVSSRNVDRVIEATRKLGETCAKCHQDNELAVKLTYRFPSFEKVKIEDPVEFMEYETGKYMKEMTNSLKAMKVFLMQGEGEKAQESGLNFVERARQLSAMCSKCHTNKLSEEVILGKDYRQALDRLEELLSTSKPSKEEIYKTLGSITVSCTKCHNVHIMPAMVREAFGK
jgi:cytochrome c556